MHPLLPKAERPHVNGTMLIPFWHMLVSIHQHATMDTMTFALLLSLFVIYRLSFP